MTVLAAVRQRLDDLSQQRGGLTQGPLNEQVLSLPADATVRLQQELERWVGMEGVQRLWNGDASLWTGQDEGQWLGWLTIVQELLEEGLGQLPGLGDELEAELFAAPCGEPTTSEQLPAEPAVVLLGMGGSSLGPEVLSQSLAVRRPLFVLDTTDPAQIRRVESQLDLTRTLFVVSSKSGTTLETRLLLDYFYGRLEDIGMQCAGKSFVAVTDEGSGLDLLARERAFRAVFYGKQSIGGRYSVLSNFGLVPSAAVGIDIERLVEAAVPMVRACAEISDNPAARLGLFLGQAALTGRDKVTLFATEEVRGFGAWAEQLLAESTGKEGKGLIPVDLEEPMAVERYGHDRVFVGFSLASGQAILDPAGGEATAEVDQESVALDRFLRALEQAGHPVVRITLQDENALSQEFFRWQFATAVSAVVLGVHPFDQPDVEDSKVQSRRLTDGYERSGSLPAEAPMVEGTTATLFADPRNQRALLAQCATDGATVGEVLAAQLQRIVPGDYFALLAYMDRSQESIELLQSMRHKVASQLGVATCLGFGPRFLHSTGQAYKGGPNSGVFLQLTHESRVDLGIPGRAFTFAVAQGAQARGDFEVLAERKRRLLRVHFRGKLVAGLQRLDGLLGRSLQSLRSG